MNAAPRIVASIGLVLLGLVPVVRANDVPSLIKQLNSWSIDKAKKASDELAAMGEPVVPEVAKALSSKSRRRGRFAARTLRQIGQDAADAIPALIESLKDSDALTREYAVEALAKMLRQAEQVMPALQKMTDDEDEDVRRQAKLAIAQLAAALNSPGQAESAQQPAAKAPATGMAAQGEDAANAARQAASQPDGAETGDSSTSAVPATRTLEKGSYADWLTPIVFIRIALLAFVVVGFFSLLYFYRAHP